jgi:hypothetical protein
MINSTSPVVGAFLLKWAETLSSEQRALLAQPLIENLRVPFVCNETEQRRHNALSKWARYELLKPWAQVAGLPLSGDVSRDKQRAQDFVDRAFSRAEANLSREKEWQIHRRESYEKSNAVVGALLEKPWRYAQWHIPGAYNVEILYDGYFAIDALLCIVHGLHLGRHESVIKSRIEFSQRSLAEMLAAFAEGNG